MSVSLYLDDCLSRLKRLEDNSVDAMVTDPPSGIAFMNAEWDTDKGGRDQWIAWLTEIMREALRVVKPGGHALVWALPRTSHWTGEALERAGWEIRDSIHHGFSTGFPKSLDISKAIDFDCFTAWLLRVRPKAKRFGRKIWNAGPDSGAAWRWCQIAAERFDLDDRGWLPGKREILAVQPQSGAKFKLAAEAIDNGGFNDPDRDFYLVTAPATAEAAYWEGFGTAVAPAHEVWWLCRKPPIEDRVIDQIRATATSGLNIDACRVGTRNQTVVRGGNKDRSAYGQFAHDGKAQEFHYEKGRWPANALFSHSEDCQPVRFVRVRSSNPIRREAGSAGLTGATYSGGRTRTRSYESPGYADEDGRERVIEYACVHGCAVKALDEQSGKSKSGKKGTGGIWSPSSGEPAGPQHGDEGAASRFFPTFHPLRYQPKPSRAEREMGCEGLPFRSAGEVTGREDGSDGLNSPRAGAGRGTGLRNHHPTLKGIDLMAWLCRLITPPGGTVLDCFMGSGTTGIACVKGGFGFIGIERDPDFFAIAEARIGYVRGEGIEELPLFAGLAPEPAPVQSSLFGAAPVPAEEEPW